MRLSGSGCKPRQTWLIIFMMLVMLFSLLGVVNTAMAATTVPVWISLNKTSDDITAGNTDQLTAIVAPAAANQSVTWTSSATAVTTVDQTGTVTAVAKGIANVTATTQDGGFTATCTVIVNDGVGSTAPSLTIKAGYSGGQYAILKTFTPSDLSALTQITQAYSYIDSMPAAVTDATQGVALTDILNSAGISLGNVQSFSFYAEDAGLYTTLSESWLYGTRYYYPNLYNHYSVISGVFTPKSGAEDGAVTVVPIIAEQEYWKRNVAPDFTKMSTDSCFRLDYGQVNDTTTDAPTSVKWVYEIDVTLNGTPVTGVSLDKTSDTITANATDQLTATVTLSDATNQGVTWTSSNNKVATVSSTGMVTAVAQGTATIAATTQDGSFFAICPVTVQPATVSVTGVSLNKTSDTITAGGTDTLAATIAPTTAANQSVTWSSDNTAVATVDQTGLATAVAAGTANITVTTADGGFTATCAVTVKAAPVLTTLTLSGSPNPQLVYSTTNLTFNLGSLTLTGSDQNGNSFSLTGLTPAWALDTSQNNTSASISGQTLTIKNSGNVWVYATISGVKSNDDRIATLNSNATAQLNIVVNGGSPITVTAAQINALNPSGTLRYYSMTKSGGMSTSYYTGLGGPLAGILSTYASVNSSQVTSVTAIGSDGYATTLSSPQSQLFATLYYYPSSGGSGQQEDTIIATQAQGLITSDPTQLDTANTLRLFMGQSYTNEVTSTWSAKWVKEIDVTVKVPVTGVSLDKTSDTITANATDHLTATVAPSNATDQSATWSSDNTAVATVDSTGKVTTVAAGTANITVTTADGSFKDTCAVTVTKSVPGGGGGGTESFPILSATPSYFEQW